MKKLIEKMASKELSFGCRVKYKDGAGNTRVSKVTHQHQVVNEGILSYKMNVFNLRHFDKKIFTTKHVGEYEVWDEYGVVDVDGVEILGHPIYIGDVLEELVTHHSVQERNDRWVKVVKLWMRCGLSKSLQIIANGSGYEEVCKHCEKEGSTWHRNHPEDNEERLKDPNARQLEEFLNPIIL